MSRLYVDGNSVRFSPFSFCQVTAIMYSGEKIKRWSREGFSLFRDLTNIYRFSARTAVKR